MVQSCILKREETVKILLVLSSILLERFLQNCMPFSIQRDYSTIEPEAIFYFIGGIRVCLHHIMLIITSSMLFRRKSLAEFDPNSLDVLLTKKLCSKFGTLTTILRSVNLINIQGTENTHSVTWN